MPSISRLWALVATASAGVLDQDDECMAAGTCAMNALQHRAIQGSYEEEDNWAVDLSFDFQDFITEADKKEYNISMEDLGIDELKRLKSAAETELQSREGTDESSEAVLGASGQSNASAKACGFQHYTGNRHTELCFCQLAGNPGCSGQRCACPQGCGSHVTWKSATTVTFKNRARAHGCHPSTVLLTVPRAYYATPADLKQCGGEAIDVIETLLKDSWNLYQRHVTRGSMHQCFHGSRTASVKYVHLQSFCSYASFHAMPNNNRAVGSCVVMHSLREVPKLARQLFNLMQ